MHAGCRTLRTWLLHHVRLLVSYIVGNVLLAVTIKTVLSIASLSFLCVGLLCRRVTKPHRSSAETQTQGGS